SRGSAEHARHGSDSGREFRRQAEAAEEEGVALGQPREACRGGAGARGRWRADSGVRCGLWPRRRQGGWPERGGARGAAEVLGALAARRPTRRKRWVIFSRLAD